ncbi:hypothetical protein DFH06DRAFT_615429 [Mycena polygramma]|nr:hypothetical protein DFH06DRAFT_615429 [Mycena polygramma]
MLHSLLLLLRLLLLVPWKSAVKRRLSPVRCAWRRGDEAWTVTMSLRTLNERGHGGPRTHRGGGNGGVNDVENKKEWMGKAATSQDKESAFYTADDKRRCRKRCRNDEQ